MLINFLVWMLQNFKRESTTEEPLNSGLGKYLARTTDTRVTKVVADHGSEFSG